MAIAIIFIAISGNGLPLLKIRINQKKAMGR